VPDRVERTWSMASVARMAAALVPVAPVQVRALRLWATSVVAGIGYALHGFAVSFEDRFVLRLTVLRWAYGALGLRSRSLARSTAVASPAAFAGTEGCVADLCTLDHEHVECYRQLLTSVAVHPPCCLPGEPLLRDR
jgi:hypothetical protein